MTLLKLILGPAPEPRNTGAPDMFEKSSFRCFPERFTAHDDMRKSEFVCPSRPLRSRHQMNVCFSHRSSGLATAGSQARGKEQSGPRWTGALGFGALLDTCDRFLDLQCPGSLSLPVTAIQYVSYASRSMTKSHDNSQECVSMQQSVLVFCATKA